MKNTTRATDQSLCLAKRSNACSVLGPGVRAVLWVQGCPFRCAECVAPESQRFSGGFQVSPEDLAVELASLPFIVGLTISGGEPMAQAGSLVRLVSKLKQERPDYGIMCYTGYTLPFLSANGTPEQNALLGVLDILIDGPYLPDRHADLLWRGSDNQKVHFLTERYLEPWITHVQKEGQGIEFEVGPDASLHWMGIPPRGFRSEFEQALAERGILVSQATHTPTTNSKL